MRLALGLLALVSSARASPPALQQLGAMAFLDAPLVLQAPPQRGPLDLTPAQAEAVGRLIWRNEGGGSVAALTHWNEGEAFASMGIGHFIWYPAGGSGPFVEGFPSVVRYLERRGAAVPPWLAGGPPCPWPDRASFLADREGPRLAELRALLASTFSLQARFIVDRSRAALPLIVAAAPPAERAELERRVAAVAQTANGTYALVDYVNFKGEGLSPAERYAGQGWGLLHVLQEMSDVPAGQPAAEEFARAAARVLRRRVANSPPARGEARWLPGWLKRVATYAEPI